MDNSQSSDVFSETSLSCKTSTEIMDTLTYDALLRRTKASLCNNAQVGKVSVPTYFTDLLEDCRLCITQSLDLVVNILLSSDVELEKLSQYMEDAVDLLQLLSNLIKNVVESLSMSCWPFKTFPTTTGHIIMLVFSHCKNSESVYGVYLTSVQKQLKELFRTCHELQLTYLMVLEKHFIFDLTVEGQLDILIDALHINLKIGEVVQSLDVKTMAEQWKAYMVLCEKYSSHLTDKSTFQECTKLLCTMIVNNLKNAIEVDQEEKVILRSMKVTSFTIKILLKMCNIFKHASKRDFTQIVDMLIYIYLHNPAYLELIREKSTPFVNAMCVNICNPLELLLKELILEEKFMNTVFVYDFIGSNEEMLLGYLFLIVNIAKCSLHINDQTPNYPKDKILHHIFKAIPHCHMWLNIGMKFNYLPLESIQSVSLFEFTLIYSVSLALTMSNEEMGSLEKILYKAILGTECYSALLASNLWTALARLSNNRQFLFSQVLSLCQIYQRLETNKSFLHSPQKSHITYTINGLFEAMRVEDRIKIFKQFSPIDDRRNYSLWSVLKIKNLPKDLQRIVKDEIMERYSTVSMPVLRDDSVEELIQVMQLASSCSFATEELEECLVQAWRRACPVHCAVLSAAVTAGSLWYYEYLNALVSWTQGLERVFWENSVNLIKVLHVISKIINIENAEVNLLLIDLLCHLAIIPIHGENKQTAELLVKESINTVMLNRNNIFLRNKIFTFASKCENKHLERIICSISDECRKDWNSFMNRSNLDMIKLRRVLARTSHYKFVHKCMEIESNLDETSVAVCTVQKSSSNFDFADLDSLFDNGGDSEPASKKLKLDTSEAEAILTRLENDASLLSNVKENMFTSEHRRRIGVVCEKLKRLVT